MHFQHSVVELRRDFRTVGIFRQREAASKSAIASLDAMEFLFEIFLLAFAFSGNAKNAVSTVTLTSSFFISGRSALSRYPRSSSLMSTSGDQSATARLSISPLPILFGKPPKKKGLKRFCVACSICLSGFHVITLFNVFILFTFLDSVKAILVHCAHRLLSEWTRILCTLRNRPCGKQTPGDLTRLRSIPEPHVFSTVVFYGLRTFRAASGISDDTTALTPAHEQICPGSSYGALWSRL